MTVPAVVSPASHPPAEPPRPWWVRAGMLLDRRPWLIFAAGALIAAVGYFTHLDRAPDFDLDEVMYTLAGQNAAGQDSLSWNALPIAVHPPLHFLLLAAWLELTGRSSDGLVQAIFAVRQLTAALSVLNVLLIGALARWYTRGAAAHVRGWLVAGAILLAASNGFLLRFGRTGLIEPVALLAGLLVVYLSLRLHRASDPVHVSVVGLITGVALLVKEPLLFTVLTPLLTAVLRRSRADGWRAAAGLMVGFLLWLTFPLWTAINGAGGWFADEHRVSAGRLIGLLQVSGLNRAGVSASGTFAATAWQYAGAYVMFALGAAGLLRAVYRCGVLRGRPADPTVASLVAFGLLGYGFLGYCLVLGQANEQLTVYGSAAAILLGLLGWSVPPGPARPAVRWIVVAGCALGVILGVASWTVTFAVGRDDGTVAVGRFVTAALPRCVAVNATGNAMRWAPVLPGNRVASHTSGPDAVGDGVTVFLLSPKDSRFRYGNSSPELDTWVRANGRLLYRAPSRRYESLQVWSVGGPPAAGSGRDCVAAMPAPAANAPAGQFVLMVAAMLVLLPAAVALWYRRAGRQRPAP